MATYVLLLALFVGTMTVAHLIPHRSIEGNVALSVETLSREGKYPSLLGVPLFRIDTFTDALMLNMAWCADEVHPVDAAMQAGLRDMVREILDNTLTPREAKVLRMRFGIDMSNDHTLEEVGRQFDVTRERIRQIEAKAIRKLKHPSRADKLRTYPG